jgi:hypothetical protein
LEVEQDFGFVQPFACLAFIRSSLLDLTPVPRAVDLAFEPAQRVGAEALQVAIAEAFSSKPF